MAYVQTNSPFAKKGDAPSRKKSLGYYNKDIEKRKKNLIFLAES